MEYCYDRKYIEWRDIEQINVAIFLCEACLFPIDAKCFSLRDFERQKICLTSFKAKVFIRIAFWNKNSMINESVRKN